MLDFIGYEDDGGGDDSWSYKTCKALIKTHLAFFQAGCPSCCITSCVKALNGNGTTMVTA